MRVRLGMVLWGAAVLGGASLLGRVLRVLSVEADQPTPPPDPHQDHLPSLGAHHSHLLWFLQISDLHLSVFQDESRATELLQFATHTVDTIQPAVVLASGDLTDAKTEDRLGSKQYIMEWAAYSNILATSGVLNKTVWLDIRGNHDNFNVPSLTSPENLYQQHSVQGQRHPRSYLYSLTQGSDSVAFIAVDACLLPGPRRPFNFIGMVTASELQLLQDFAQVGRSHNYTVWFGHYPTSCILSPQPGIRQVMGSGPYLCGHFHTMGGLVPHMYTRQHTGALELELGDWKDGRIFRVAALDHGLFSFVDVVHGTWPIILVTNPKHALFTTHHHEPVHLLHRSSHIRVLLWSQAAIVEARVRTSEAGTWLTLRQVSGPLYVAPWSPEQYMAGLHTLQVYARDADGREQLVRQPFSLDGSQPAFHFWPRALLMSNLSLCFQVLFGMLVCACVLPLCVLRCLHHLVLEKRMGRPRVRWWPGSVWLRKLWVLSSIDRLFWPLILTALYLPVGPWFVGEVIEGHVGVVFAWGTFVNQSFLPGSLTYAYGFFQLLVFHFPFTLAVAHCADFRLWSQHMGSTSSLLGYLCCHLWLLILVTFQMTTAYFFWLAYGTLALVLGPLRTWSAILGILLWHQAATLPPSCLRGSVQVWLPHPLTWEQEEDEGRTSLKVDDSAATHVSF